MHPKLFYTVYLGGTHPYHTLGPLNRPLRHSRALQKGPFGPKRPCWGPHRVSEGPGGPDLVPIAANWSDWVKLMVTTHFGLLLGLFWAQGPPKGPFLAQKAPFGGQIWIRIFLSEYSHVGCLNLRNGTPWSFNGAAAHT